MADLKSLLERKDIVGGEIQVVLSKKSVYRSSIQKVSLLGDIVYFKLNWTKRESSLDGEKSVWTREGVPNIEFSADRTLFGGHRPQFDIDGGWVIIYPVGDSALIGGR